MTENEIDNLQITQSKAIYSKVSIVVPVYNEKKYIESIVEILKKAPTLGLEKEIILVDDFSTDGTREILKGYEGKEIKVIFKDKNGGKGSALKVGFAQASGDIVIVQDADLEYDPFEYPLVLAPFLDNKADIVYGSRYLKNSLRQVPKFWHTVFNKLFTMLSNALTNLYLTDEQTCYKVFNQKVLKDVGLKLESNAFGFDPEFTVRISKGDYKIMEVPISYFPRSAAKGKHMNFKAQLDTLKTLLLYSWKLR